MAKYVIDETTLTAIGDSIRAKEGTTADVPVTEMAERVLALQDTRMKEVIEGTIQELEDEAIHSVGSYGFYYNTSLRKVSLPNVTRINREAFGNCSVLTEVYLPSMTSVGTGAFRYCTSLKQVHFPALKTATGNIFQYCSALETVELPKVTALESGAFQGCIALKTVKLGGRVTSLGTKVFYNCQALEWIDFSGCTSVPTMYSDTIYNLPATCEIRVPASLLSQWKAATNWSTYASRIVGV